ncbi:MAG: Tim44 domain-containing protein [Alphaproteobacteria bacterium]|nr:Tim44 domain-containing protein [Alphaproteobacteria bacterium]
MDHTGIALLDIIFFAMVAGFLILRLRSVLGRRNGDENSERWRPRTSQTPAPGAPRSAEPLPDNVTRFPDRAPGTEAPAAAPGTVEAGIAAIRSADPSFDPKSFQQGARAAFEMILGAFAQGDADALRPLLGDEVYRSFSGAIRDRKEAKQTLATTMIGIKSAEIVAAALQGRDAVVTVKFVSEQVNVTRDAAGAVIEGDPNRVETLTDVWTFSRNTRARDPNWLLVQTSDQH